jgi:hypothetical protein
MAQTFPLNGLDKPWKHSYGDVLDAYRVEIDSGLDEGEVRRRWDK